MSRYRKSNDPVSLYLWNTRLSKAFLEDVEHVEVLLRNFISTRLTTHCGTSYWFDDVERYHFNNPFRASHQEPFIDKSSLTKLEQDRITDYYQALLRTATRIEPQAASWIHKHSRVSSILTKRPQS
ncbi:MULTISPECIES: hypothetical protein [unclassified Corynebacterium]|uniref:hypothetical protein n=1 Tax=unclassified Corynebacterium TaxID=2624378 RepID=UPI001B312F2E|nr:MULTISPECIES: hypothetical protein [unclassified Corynebacterium]